MLNLTKKKLDKSLNIEQGYVISLLSHKDLKKIRNLVQNQWREVLNSYYPEKVSEIRDLDISDYHKISNQIDHKKIWPMKNRILSLDDFKVFLSTDLYRNIKSIYPDAVVSDENNIGHGEVYWRIVRPMSTNDVGPVHADRWFWDINDDYTPPKMRRVKFWISLWCDGKNGLGVIPNTQLKKYNFDYEFRDGENKPVFFPEKYDLRLSKIDSSPGTIIIFHDNLLHGGCINQSKSTRVSIEFTIFTQKLIN